MIKIFGCPDEWYSGVLVSIWCRVIKPQILNLNLCFPFRILTWKLSLIVGWTLQGHQKERMRRKMPPRARAGFYSSRHLTNGLMDLLHRVPLCWDYCCATELLQQWQEVQQKYISIYRERDWEKENLWVWDSSLTTLPPSLQHLLSSSHVWLPVNTPTHKTHPHGVCQPASYL